MKRINLLTLESALPLAARFFSFLFFIFSLSAYGKVEGCQKIPSNTQALLVFQNDLPLLDNPRFTVLLRDYFSLLKQAEGLQGFACHHSSKVGIDTLKDLLTPLHHLKGLMLIGDFQAPIITSQESRSYNFEINSPDPTPSFYYLADFLSQYDKLDSNHWNCVNCTDFEILNRVSFPIGVLRSYRDDNFDLLHYFHRANLLRRKLSRPPLPVLTVARSGFDSLGALKEFDDPISQNSGYPRIASVMGLEHQAFLRTSRLKTNEWSPDILDNAKKKTQEAFRRTGTVFVSLMHGHHKYAGGNSKVGPFLNSDEESQLSGGALFNVFHSCSTGVELVPKSLVYIKEGVGQSNRLGALAAITDTHKMAVLPNNLLALNHGARFGETALAMSNQIEMTYFGDPFLRLTGKEPLQDSLLQSFFSSGQVFNPRSLPSLCRGPLKCEQAHEQVFSFQMERASQRATALMFLPEEDSTLKDWAPQLQDLAGDPHPLVRLVLMKKLFGLGITGVRIFDELKVRIPGEVAEQIRQQDRQELDALEYDDFIGW